MTVDGVFLVQDTTKKGAKNTTKKENQNNTRIVKQHEKRSRQFVASFPRRVTTGQGAGRRGLGGAGREAGDGGPRVGAAVARGAGPVAAHRVVVACALRAERVAAPVAGRR